MSATIHSYMTKIANDRNNSLTTAYWPPGVNDQSLKENSAISNSIPYKIPICLQDQ